MLPNTKDSRWMSVEGEAEGIFMAYRMRSETGSGPAGDSEPPPMIANSSESNQQTDCREL